MSRELILDNPCRCVSGKIKQLEGGKPSNRTIPLKCLKNYKALNERKEAENRYITTSIP